MGEPGGTGPVGCGSGGDRSGDGADPVRRDRIYESAGQLERTALSWNRTLLAFAVNGVLLVKLGWDRAGWVATTGAAVLLFTLLAWFITSRTYRKLRGRPAQALLARRPYALGAALFAGVVGLANLAAIAAYS